MNDDILKDFTKAEIEVALKNMKPLKAPELDGITPIFFQFF